MRVAGIGCRADAPLAALQAALDAAEAQAGPVDALATIAARGPHLAPLAGLRALPLHLVAVEGIATPTRSPRILALHGTGSVAEAAALAAAGPGARIVAVRHVSPCGQATAAIAETAQKGPA